MTAAASGGTVAFVATEGTEQVEWQQPWKAVEDAGGRPVLLSPGGDAVQFFEHLDKGEKVDADGDVASADPGDYDVLVLPGGVAGSDFLRADQDVVSFVRDFGATGKPIAAICHAGWILIEAGLAQSKRLTSFPSLRTDLENAGANWVDETVVVDGQLITSRNPDDLEAFSSAIVERLPS